MNPHHDLHLLHIYTLKHNHHHDTHNFNRRRQYNALMPFNPLNKGTARTDLRAAHQKPNTATIATMTDINLKSAVECERDQGPEYPEEPATEIPQPCMRQHGGLNSCVAL